jgi:hypothetical protein
MDDGLVSKKQYACMSRGEAKKVKGNSPKILAKCIGHAKYYAMLTEEFASLLEPYQNTEEEDPQKQNKQGIRREPELEKNLALYYLVLGDKR